MGLLGGSVSTTKFFVRGELKKNFTDALLKAVRLRAFQELSPDEDLEERAGWCVAGKPLDTELAHDKIYGQSMVYFALRIDRWRIPKPLFKAHFDEAAAALSAKTGREKLSKREKEDIKLRINRKLKKRLIPAMRHYDLCWDLHRRELRFWNRSPRTNEELRTLFDQCFATLELTLDQESPFMLAKGLLNEQQLEALSQLEASSFATL
jgi:recombination associated protein RdgC